MIWLKKQVQVQVVHDWIYIDFQTDHFADFEQFKIGSHFADFGQVKIEPTCLFLLFLGRSLLFY